MAEKMTYWPILDKYNLMMKKLSPLDGSSDAKFALFVPIAGQPVDAEIDAKLISAGFDKMGLDGAMVYAREGGIKINDLGGIFPDFAPAQMSGKKPSEIDVLAEMSVAERDAKFTVQGTLVEWVEPQVSVEEPEGEDEVIFDMATLDLIKESFEDQVPEEVITADVVPEPVAVVPESVPEEPVEEQVEDTPSDAVSADPSSVEDVVASSLPKDEPAVEAQAEIPRATDPEAFSSFEAFMIYEGVPADARESLLAGLTALNETFSFDELWEQLRDPSEVREVFTERASNAAQKAVAKSIIIETVYPFAKEFLSRTSLEVDEFERFATEQGASMDEFSSWFREFSKSIVASTHHSKIERGLRSCGIRKVLQMGAGDRQVDRVVRKSDARFKAMDLKGRSIFDNFKQGLVTPLRDKNHPEFIQEALAEFANLVTDMEPLNAPTA